MKANGCRDCIRCTESPMKAASLMLWRSTKMLAGGWLIRMFRQSCPQCRHLVARHQRTGGRFVD